jgi:adenylate kinase family enzyme
MKPPPLPLRQGPLIMEVIGVAGSGKSSLAAALVEGHEDWILEGPLQMRNTRHLRRAMHGVARLGRITAVNLSRRRLLSWRESKYVLYVMEWSRHLRSMPTQDSRVIVLDQGPVYVLARFGTADVPIAGCEPASEWWRGITANWADTLDVVIALEAPDSVLWERVTTRDRSHEALDRGRSAWSTFAESYRRSFATVLAAMERPDGPQILRYDTSRMSTDEIARHVTESVGAVWSHGERSLGAADDGGDAG